MLERFNRLIDELVEHVRAQPTYGWATVTSVDPLQIRYDGQTDPVVGSPSGDTAGLVVGDRVWCQRIHRRDIVLVNRRSGRPYAMAAGIASITPVANTPTTVTVTFPVGRFTRVPVVSTSVTSAVVGTVVLGYGHTNVTTTSMDAVVTRTNNTDTSVHWHAVQMTADSASG